MKYARIFVNKLIRHPLSYLIFLYFFIHLINLTAMPIFNDESIYLDWAWSSTHIPGQLFDSLLDAKQPLMIWVFALFENVIPDPLFAGRFASVLIGALTLIGIFSVTEMLVHRKAAVVASLLYMTTPLFVYYNRQALMESAVACVGMWSFFALTHLIREPRMKHGAILGAILGVGFFIKSSTVLFIVPSALMILFYALKRKAPLAKPVLVAVGVFLCITLALFFNPDFWKTLHTNSRYSFTLAELVRFPIAAWMHQLLGLLEITLIYITPLVFLSAVVGSVRMVKHNVRHSALFLVFFSVALCLEVLLGKVQGQRYVVAFLPFLVIPASFFLVHLWKKGIAQKLVIGAVFVLPVMLTAVLVFHFDSYFTQLAKISRYADLHNIRGQTSGYGIQDAIGYIKDHTDSATPVILMIALNTGNPENAVNLYSRPENNLFVVHGSATFFPEIAKIECLTSVYPTFFITRNAELSGLERYYRLEKAFVNPDGVTSVGVYSLQTACEGASGSLSDFYAPAMEKIRQIKGLQ